MQNLSRKTNCASSRHAHVTFRPRFSSVPQCTNKLKDHRQLASETKKSLRIAHVLTGHYDRY